MTRQWTLGVASEYAVVGYNPENADMDRPNGEIVGEVYFLVAEDARGNRRTFGSWRSEEEAQKALPWSPPVGYWIAGRPAYGSEAWIAYGAADELALEARERDAEAYGIDTRWGAF